MENLKILKQKCLKIYLATKDKNIRKIMRAIDKIIKKELIKQS